MQKIMLFTDPHYLSPDLYLGSQLLERELRREEGRMTAENDILFGALKKEIASEKPDALIIPGDLSFNGEKKSHEDMAAFLESLASKGLPVFVIPGNHDILNPAARDYSGSELKETPPVTADEFRALYAPFLRAPEGSPDAGMSYRAVIGGRLAIVMLDMCLYKDRGIVPGLYTPDHQKYLESVLLSARWDGLTAITVSHHSAIPQTGFGRDLFAVLGHERLAQTLKDHGVRLHLSGHLHTQHIARSGRLADASTGSLSVYPHLIALITLGDDGTIRYEARPLKEENLPPRFMERSRRFFLDVSREKNLRALNSLPLSPRQKEIMADFSARFNLAFYGGTYESADPRFALEEGYALWQKYPAGIFGQYFNHVIRESSAMGRVQVSGEKG